MFRVIEYRNDSGKIRMTIETTDQMAADFLRFFGAADKFVELFHFRMRMEKGIDHYQKTKSLKLRIAQKELAAQLKQFRELPGTRAERLRVLKEIRVANGENVTQDRIDAEIRFAMKHEKDLLVAKIMELSAAGKSAKAIARSMRLPVATIYRYLQNSRRSREKSPEKPLVALKIDVPTESA